MKQHFKIINLLFVLFLILYQGEAQQVKWVCSTQNERWQLMPPIPLDSNTGEKQNVEILVNARMQTIDGWGGCFNELGWDALLTLKEEQRNKVLAAFFDTTTGLGNSICRMPVGANDYARSWYTPDDTENDFGLEHFSLERDKSGLIPYILAAMRFNPHLKIWASPWSPPVWMKTNHHYANQPGDHNDLPVKSAVGYGNQLIQSEKVLHTYAQYLSRFVQEYQNAGIPIYALHFQNEPFTYNQWPNCSWTAAAMENFIAQYLGPAFEKEKTRAAIWFGTMNNGNPAVFDTVLSSPVAFQYIHGVGFQYEGKAVVSYIKKKYPGLSLMQTETDCGNGSVDWKAAEHSFQLIQDYLDSGVNAYMYWNMILDETGKSSWGWKQNAQVTVNKENGTVTYTPEYYLLKHFSYFIKPGSVKLQSAGTFPNQLAFITPCGKIILVAMNAENQTRTLIVKAGNRSFTTVLPARSFNTFQL